MTDVCNFKMIKVACPFKDVSASTLYDVLHDPAYRKSWDSSMIEGYEICCINPNNDIGYYSLKAPKPLKARDFVTQRSWLDMGQEKFILNHSVNHELAPPKKNLVRGISHLTGYYITTSHARSDTPGCHLCYVTQSDPKGKLPVWAVNKAANFIAPKVMTKIHKAAKGYEKWKAAHNPHFKPWVFPEQMSLPRLDMKQILSTEDLEKAEAIDEMDASEGKDEIIPDAENGDSASNGSGLDN